MKPRSSSNIDVHIGSRLRAARIEQRYSQSHIGEQLGISFQQIQKYEKGVNRVSAARLTEFSEHYQKPVVWFLQGSDRNDVGLPGADIGAKMLATAGGRKLCEAFLAIAEPEERALLIHLAEVFVRRSTRRHLQAAQ